MWVGWMNLENLYGSQETLVKVFESALQQNEPIEIYKKLAAIYVQSKKQELAGKLYQTIVKKFSAVLSVWLQYTTFLMKQGKQAQARVLLQKAMKALPSKPWWALMEFLGCPPPVCWQLVKHAVFRSHNPLSSCTTLLRLKCLGTSPAVVILLVLVLHMLLHRRSK